ncbi:helix-turn-helix domain-containing protein [Vibrio breoganii]
MLNKGLTKEQASKAVGIGVATLYRYLKTNR